MSLVPFQRLARNVQEHFFKKPPLANDVEVCVCVFVILLLFFNYDYMFYLVYEYWGGGGGLLKSVAEPWKPVLINI